MQINTAPLRAAVAAVPGEIIAVAKADLKALLDAVDNGAADARDLANIRTIVNFTPRRLIGGQ